MSAHIDRFPGNFPGTIKAPLDIASFTKQSEIVCQGLVVSVDNKDEIDYLVGNRPLTFQRMVATFQVDRVYKGILPSTRIEVEFLQPTLPASLERLYQEEYLLLFLLEKGTRYQFANLTTSKMPMSRVPLSREQPGATPIGRIRQALIQSLDDPDHRIVVTVIEQLALLKSPETIAALRQLVTSPDPDVSRAATAALTPLGR